MDEADRAAFVAGDAGRWNVLRHRMPISSAATLHDLRLRRRLELRAATVTDVAPLSEGGLRVGLSDGTRADFGWVVNCTGPQSDVRRLANPLLDELLSPAGEPVPLATASTGGMGVRTENGRLVDAEGSSAAPLWTLGALRRGELWESTAVPEIRTQALALANAVLEAVAPLPRRLADGRVVSGHHPIARPRDPLGLPLSTTAEAASSFNAGLERVMRLQDGAEDLLRQATELDPDFALAHAALAMLGHEAGARADVTASLAAAREAVRKRGDARERSLVEVIGRRVGDVRHAGADALMGHISSYPRDVLAVSAAVPTIAFSGVTDLRQEAWSMVENLAPAYGDHWWYISLLAFTRQEQGRFEDAGLLAESALACEPASGHAAHAQTHVMYETGQHAEGRTWLDHWIAESGRSAGFRAHFAWHAALHELALGDLAGVNHRYCTHLAPPAVTGVRALVDSASLIWRWQLTAPDSAPDSAAGHPPSVAPVLAAVDPGLLFTPQTPFIAVHAAIALAAAGDSPGLAALRRHCAAATDPAMRTSAVAVCDALSAMCQGRWETAWRWLDDLLPGIEQLAGSAAQREVFQDALLYCLIQDGRLQRAEELRDARSHAHSR
jgi:tetratricopeptide (TPR) repeat protein